MQKWEQETRNIHLQATLNHQLQHQQQRSSMSFPFFPGIGLGPFRLGNSIGCVIHHVQQHAMKFRNNELLSAPNQPITADLTLDLKDIGVRLRFDSHQQRLTLIDVYDPQRLPLVYMRSFLSPKVGQPATFASLYALVGPTYPGSYDEESQQYMLQYPGCCMTFHLPSSPAIDGEHGQQVITLPDGSSPPLERLFIHSGALVQEHLTALPPLSSNDIYFEPITVYIGRGMLFQRRQVWIGFDSYVQDLLAELGAPQNAYFKQGNADKMNIHKHQAGSQSQSQTHSPNVHSRHLVSQPSTLMTRPPTADYFYNYFLMGFDVLLDGITHRVKKLILHTNFVDRPDFAQYSKCNFTIVPDFLQAAQRTGGLGPEFLELPPTAVSQASGGRSMLHPPTSNLSTDSLSASPISNPPSPPQSIQVRTGVEDAAVITSSKSKKAAKKKTTAAVSAASSSNTSPQLEGKDASRSPLPPRPTSSAGGCVPSLLGTSPPSALVSFSPSLSPSILPHSHATVITADSKWSDVLAVLGPCPSRPMVSSSNSQTTMASRSGAMTAANSSAGGPAAVHHSPDNPFASTYFYAYPQIVFEVMRSHQLAGVTLFKD